VLVDLTDLPTINISSDEIREIAAFKPRLEGKRAIGKTAFLATTDLLYGLARMLENQNTIQGASHSVMVFRDMESAIYWINAAD